MYSTPCRCSASISCRTRFAGRRRYLLRKFSLAQNVQWYGQPREASTSAPGPIGSASKRSEEHTSELQSHLNLVCRLLLEKKKKHESTKHKHLYYSYR